MATNQKTYSIIQSNGQRIYFPGSNTCAPPRGSEVFVGNLPRDLFEDELIPVFSQVGPIYKLRLMMDFSGVSRGFAFVNYYTVEDANLAVSRFNDYPIRKNGRFFNFITVHISMDNCRLFFGNVPRNKTAEQIREDLKRVVDGVVKAIVYADTSNDALNRGFAFVEFESHAMAAIARRKLLAGVQSLWGNQNHDRRLCVDWAEPEPIINPSVLMQVKILYFKNVPVAWSPDRFNEFFHRILKNTEVSRLYKKNNYAFVHFYTRSDAERAMKMIKSVSKFLVFNGLPMEVEWARPALYSRKNREQQVPESLCLSVPPKIRKMVLKKKEVPHPMPPRRPCPNRRPDNNRIRNDSTESDLFTEIDIAAAEEFLTNQFHRLSLYTN